MITIYSSKGVTYQPYSIATERIEDCRERQFVVNSMHWFIFEIIDLFRNPIQLAVFYLLMAWPVILYG